MTVPSLTDLIDSAARNPDYGYNGKIQEIRQLEYSHLGGLQQNCFRTDR